MPRRYKILEMRGETMQDRMAKGYVVQLPMDDERLFPPVVYRCNRCYGRFYTLSKFAEHLTMKHGIPYSQVWRFVQGVEVR